MFIKLIRIAFFSLSCQLFQELRKLWKNLTNAKKCVLVDWRSISPILIWEHDFEEEVESYHVGNNPSYKVASILGARVKNTLQHLTSSASPQKSYNEFTPCPLKLQRAITIWPCLTLLYLCKMQKHTVNKEQALIWLSSAATQWHLCKTRRKQVWMLSTILVVHQNFHLYLKVANVWFETELADCPLYKILKWNSYIWELHMLTLVIQMQEQ